MTGPSTMGAPADVHGATGEEAADSTTSCSVVCLCCVFSSTSRTGRHEAVISDWGNGWGGGRGDSGSSAWRGPRWGRRAGAGPTRSGARGGPARARAPAAPVHHQGVPHGHGHGLGHAATVAAHRARALSRRAISGPVLRLRPHAGSYPLKSPRNGPPRAQLSAV